MEKTSQINETQQTPEPLISRPVSSTTILKSFSLLLGAFLVVISVGIAGYFLGTRQAQNTSSLKVSEPLASPTSEYIAADNEESSETLNSLANWRSVNVSKWSYKLPPGWHFVACTGGDYVMMSSAIKEDSTRECNFDGTELVTFNVLPKDYEIPATTIPGKAGGIYTVVSNKQDIIIGGKTGMIQNQQNVGGQGEGNYLVAYIKLPNSIQMFSLNDVSQEKVFREILKSIEFDK